MKNYVIVGIMILATVITRFLPFILFPPEKKTPEYITYLGTVLPFASVGMLVVYCLKHLNLAAAPFGLPEIIAVAVIVLLHWKKGNALISIGAGTMVYMILVQAVFITA